LADHWGLASTPFGFRETLSAEIIATEFYEFAVFTIADWQAELNRGMDAWSLA